MYDYVIIGSGHNSLVAACYLAKYGNKVCVLERSDQLGGCTVTEEIIPNFRISSVAYAFSLFSPRIINDLGLKESGLHILKRPIHSYTPDREGYGLAMGDPKLTAKEIGRYSGNDVVGYMTYCDLIADILSNIEDLIDEIPPIIETNGRRLGMIERLVNMSKLYGVNKKVSRISKRGLIKDTIALLSGPATPILERFIEKDPLKATLATDGIIGSWVAPSQNGSGYVLLHHVMGESGGEKGVWGYVEGGMGRLTEVLVSVAKRLDVSFCTNHQVTEIITKNGKAVGVVAQSREIDAKKGVISGTNLTDTVNMVDTNGQLHLPVEFLRDTTNIQYEAACSKINFALDRLPEFLNGLPCDRPDLNLLTGTVHIPSKLEDVELAFQEASQGMPSTTTPILEMTFPSTVDSTLTYNKRRPRDKSKHVMSVLVQYTPYELKGATWDKYKDEYADRCMDVIEEHAPGFKNSVLGRQIITPLDLERKYGLKKGDIFHGALNPSQMFSCRPVAGWSDHTTPIKSLYMCGSACHPGGGVTGIPGLNAAMKVLKKS